jgi:hypothetical protein
MILTLIVVFWVLMPCSLLGGYQHLGGTYCPFNPEDEGNTVLCNAANHLQDSTIPKIKDDDPQRSVLSH